jgi:hypothetical protein
VTTLQFALGAAGLVLGSVLISFRHQLKEWRARRGRRVWDTRVWVGLGALLMLNGALQLALGAL